MEVELSKEQLYNIIIEQQKYIVKLREEYIALLDKMEQIIKQVNVDEKELDYY